MIINSLQTGDRQSTNVWYSARTNRPKAIAISLNEEGLGLKVGLGVGDEVGEEVGGGESVGVGFRLCVGEGVGVIVGEGLGVFVTIGIDAPEFLSAESK